MSNWENLSSVEITHLSDWREVSPSTKCNLVRIGDTLIAFSYSTIIAVMHDFNWYVVDPKTAPEHTKINSATTRGHINAITLGNKDLLMPYDKFQQLLIDSKIKVTTFIEEE